MSSHEHEDDFKEMELWEHLQELRTRLIRSACYLILGLSIAWAVYPWLNELFFAPLTPVLKQIGGKIVYTHFAQGFMLQLQVSLVAGLIVAIPLVTLELWGFIAPGLTKSERKACYVVFPLSLLFFFMGIICGYELMSVTISYFAQYIPKDVELLQDPLKYIVFLVKMVVAFGICFQMPVVLMFLAYVGLVNSTVLREQWRMAVVGCFIVAAVATPGGDPLTMMIMAAPLALLYVSSIFLVGFVERVRDAKEKKLALDGA
ncbi:MAG: tatC [Armatimonadetes bacterium]|jgi:sec-independent protein translocase protein TatC|nr:tatC [Armatimonadota bacterium]